MGGLRLNVGGGVNATAGIPGSSTPAPRTITEAGFGPGASNAQPSKVAALWPNDPFGVAFWSGVAGVALLLVIRHSLPN